MFKYMNIKIFLFSFIYLLIFAHAVHHAVDSSLTSDPIHTPCSGSKES